MSKIYTNNDIFPHIGFTTIDEIKDALVKKYGLDNLMLISFFTIASSTYIENLVTRNVKEEYLEAAELPFYYIKRLEADLKIKDTNYIDNNFGEVIIKFTFTATKYKVWDDIYHHGFYKSLGRILYDNYERKIKIFRKGDCSGKYSKDISYYIISKDDAAGYKKFYYEGGSEGILLSSQLIKEAEGEDCLKIINPEYYMEDVCFSKQNRFNIPPLILADIKPIPFTFIKEFSFSIFDIEGGN